MRLIVSVAALSLTLATSVAARPAPDQPAPDQPTVQPAPNGAATPASTESGDKKKDGIICRKEMPTGSHFPVKVCTTAEQRKAQHSSTQRAQEMLQRPSEVVPQ